MAIVKILKSSKTFAAVDYNESRVKKGEAQLICASNFPVSVVSPAGYKDYFKLWSRNNKRIKNPQLHIVISLKGKESNPDVLLSIAKVWLDKMGYGENPYLVYLHNNTNNTHIHIITTRVDKYGRKVDHSFEKKRSQRVLGEINGVDKLQELRNYVAGVLRYSFSTVTQFSELCKDAGINVLVDDDTLVLEKDGKSLALSKRLIEFCSVRYKKNIDEKYKKSLQAKIFKYATLLDKESFQSYMRKNFGLKFIYYGKGNNLYGFSIIDYKNQAVYKGSEVFSLKKLNELFSLPSKTYQDKYNLLLADFFKSNKYAGLLEVNGFLIKEGIITDGTSYFEMPDNDLLGFVDDKLKNKILFNTRVNKILNDYKPVTLAEKMVLSKIYHIPLSALNRPFTGSTNNDDILYYKGLINDCIDAGGNLRETLAQYNIDVHFLNDSFVLCDSSNKVVVSNDRLGVGYDTFKNALHSHYTPFDFGQRFEDEYVGVDYDYEPDILLSDVMSGLLTIRAGVGGGSGSRKKKKP